MGSSPNQWVYHDKRWAVARRLVFARDGHNCKIKLPGCTGFARTADHIVALEDGGAPFDLQNLQAACGHCNVAKENLARERRAVLMEVPRRVW